MSDATPIQRALLEGAAWSRRACSLPADDALPVAIWRRHKWKIIGFALFVAVELIGLGALASGMNHF